MLRRRRHIGLIALDLGLVLAGLGAILFLASDYLVLAPVHTPQDPLTETITEEELSAHVRFLAQPALKGRRPLTMGSRVARRYIAKRFEACGLLPWGDANGYEQPVVVGSNVIGVLPGADRRLANEIVLVSAHYDHLGGAYLGACDNASGVAALLEVAEHLSLSETKPRRSIAFAAFDCEELGLFGSVAFTCRDDFNPEKIAAVVNADMLGRQFLDVMDNTLFVVGTRGYPQARRHAAQLGVANGMRLLPFGNDLVGPRGDHAVFGPLGVPCLFFSCGLFPEYHGVGDTADRIDFAALKRSAEIIKGTVEYFAQGEPHEWLVQDEESVREEMLAIATTLGAVLEECRGKGLAQEHQHALEQSVADINKLAAERGHTSSCRRRMIATGLDSLVRSAVAEAHDADSVLANYTGLLSQVEEAQDWEAFAPPCLEAYRAFVKEVLKQNIWSLGIWGMDDFNSEAFFVSEKDIEIAHDQDGTCHLNAVIRWTSVWAWIDGAKDGGSISFDVALYPIECHGTVGDIVDRCLLGWLYDLRDEDTTAAVAKSLQGMNPEERAQLMRSWNDPTRKSTYDAAWYTVLENVTGEAPGPEFTDWLQWRLAQVGLSSKEAWVCRAMESENPDIQRSALMNSRWVVSDGNRQWFEQLVGGIVGDRTIRSDVRARAIQMCGSTGTLDRLNVVVEHLNDTTLVRQPALPHDGAESAACQCSSEPCPAAHGSTQGPDVDGATIGDIALHVLRTLTEQDLGKNPSAWRQWLTQEYDGTRPSRGIPIHSATDNEVNKRSYSFVKN